jgi:hypothetical protein
VIFGEPEASARRKIPQIFSQNLYQIKQLCVLIDVTQVPNHSAFGNCAQRLRYQFSQQPSLLFLFPVLMSRQTERNGNKQKK